MATPDIMTHSIRDLGRALREGTTTAETLLDGAIDRHHSMGRPLNAYKTWDEDGARAQARAADAVFAAGIDHGTLQGLPVSVKDIYGVRGLSTYAGSPRRLPAKWESEGPVVAAVRDNLAVIPGKTNSVEFAFGGIGTNAHGGTPCNPWDPANPRACGGSSAGAGVSLAWGSAVVALGTDTGGSVRLPATFTGAVGLKLSIGRWSTDGIVPLSTTFDTPGLLTRTVEDAAYAFGALDSKWRNGEACFKHLSGVELSGLRLGICDEYFWDDCFPGVAEGVKAALDALAKKGAHIVNVSLPEAQQSHDCFVKGDLFAVEGVAFLDRELPEWHATIDPNVAFRLDAARKTLALDYYASLRRSEELAASALDTLRAVDVLVTPTSVVTPPTLEEVAVPEAYQRLNGLATKNTRAVNMLRQCAITMPVALDRAGMPVGMQLVGGWGADERILAAALAVERALGTAADRIGRPPLCSV